MVKHSIAWTEELRTHLLWQDFQHQEFFRKFVDLRDSILDGSRSSELEHIKGYLHFYAKDHFGIEESYMALFQYPETEAHKKEHAIFLEKLKALYPKEEELLSGMALCTDLEDWFKNHILQVDKKFACFIKEHDVHSQTI